MAPIGKSAPVPNEPALPLQERVTFLVHTVHSRIGLIGNRHFRAHDLNHYSARILVLLLEYEELRTGELVDLMVLPQSTISSQLQALHARRLVRRRRSRKDNRSVMVTLTPAGAELARQEIAVVRQRKATLLIRLERLFELVLRFGPFPFVQETHDGQRRVGIRVGRRHTHEPR